MKHVMKILSKILMFLFMLGVFLFIASLTLGLAELIFPGHLERQYMSLLLFDGGALVWTLAFIYNSKGFQKGLTLFMAGFDLLGTVFVAWAEVMLSQTMTTVPEMISWAAPMVLTVWGAANLWAIYALHIGDPDSLQEIKQQVRVDKVIEQAENKADEMLEAEAHILAQQIADRHMAEARHALGLAARPQLPVVNVQARPAPLASEPRPALRETQPAEPADPSLMATILAAIKGYQVQQAAEQRAYDVDLAQAHQAANEAEQAAQAGQTPPFGGSSPTK